MRENPGSALNRCLTHVNCSFDCSVIVLVGTNLWEHNSQVQPVEICPCVGLRWIEWDWFCSLGFEFFPCFYIFFFSSHIYKTNTVGLAFCDFGCFPFRLSADAWAPPKGNLPSTTHCWKISRFPKQIKTNQNMVISTSSIFVTSTGI